MFYDYFLSLASYLWNFVWLIRGIFKYLPWERICISFFGILGALPIQENF